MDQRDSAGLTPLMWAAMHGHEEVVRLLLQRGRARSDIQDREYGRTALSWAAGNGHGGVVRVFLGGMVANSGSMGRVLGNIAQVMSGQFRKKYINPDKPDNSGQTPLFRAAGGGHVGVVKLLLERGDISPNRPDNDGQTPLSWAASSGHDGVVNLLLEREDASPGRLDNDGRNTALVGLL